MKKDFDECHFKKSPWDDGTIYRTKGGGRGGHGVCFTPDEAKELLREARELNSRFCAVMCKMSGLFSRADFADESIGIQLATRRHFIRFEDLVYQAEDFYEKNFFPPCPPKCPPTL